MSDDSRLSKIAGRIVALVLIACLTTCLVAITVKFVWWLLF